MNMHPSIIAVFTKKTPGRHLASADCMIWHRDVGLLVPVASIKHGLVLWAQAERQEKRLEMRFDEPILEIVFPEKFRQNARDRATKNHAEKPISVIRARALHTSAERSSPGDEKAYRLLRTVPV
jgi:hypothetical protein